MKNEHHLTVSDLLSHIDKSGKVPSITRQAELLGISRSCVYYTPIPVDPFTLEVMNKIDEVYTRRPYYGSRRIAKEVGNQLRIPVNRKRVQGLIPKFSAHSETHKDLPQYFNVRFLLVFLTCSFLVTHRQFSLQ